MLTVAYCFGSSCISITSHDWNIPRSLQFHSGFRFDLFGRVLMGPLTAPHALVDSVSSFSCFPHSACLCASVCLRGTTTGDTQGDRNAHFCVIWLGSPPAWHSPFLVLSHVLKCAQTRYTIIAHLPPSSLFLARVAQFIQVRSQFKCGQKQYANCKLQNNKVKICDKAAIHVLYGAAGMPWPTGPVVHTTCLLVNTPTDETYHIWLVNFKC